MSDRLLEIMALQARAAVRTLDPENRAALRAEFTALDARQQTQAELGRMAFARLPEDQRLHLVKSAGVGPDACGPELAVAPARGAMRVFDLLEPYPDGERGTKLRPAGFQGRKTAQLADAFDRMRAQAQRRGADPVLSPSQVGMGRMYATLVRTHASGGAKGSWPSGGGKGGDAVDFNAHLLDMGKKVRLYQRRIGAGVAMDVRRVRPSARADGVLRGPITDRALVDGVCLDDLVLSEVLGRHGWSVKADHIRAVGRALAAALDRMIGPLHRPDIVTVHFGEKSSWAEG